MFAEAFVRLIYIGLNFIKTIGQFGYDFAFLPIKDTMVFKSISLVNEVNPIGRLGFAIISKFFGNFTWLELVLTIGLVFYIFITIIKAIINIVNPISL